MRGLRRHVHRCRRAQRARQRPHACHEHFHRRTRISDVYRRRAMFRLREYRLCLRRPSHAHVDSVEACPARSPDCPCSRPATRSITRLMIHNICSPLLIDTVSYFAVTPVRKVSPRAATQCERAYALISRCPPRQTCGAAPKADVTTMMPRGRSPPA